MPAKPLPVPTSDPAPFAPLPTGPCHWPVRTADPRKREVAYTADDSTIIGNRDRRFAAMRSEGKRYHVGVDLYGNVGDAVVACTAGVVVSFYEFYAGSYALFVDHGAFVANYAELKGNSLKTSGLNIGAAVAAGQQLGTVAQLVSSHMCHFETYRPGTEANKRWLVGQKRPAALLNPTALLLHLAVEGIGIDAKKAARLNAKLAEQLNWQTKLGEIAHAFGLGTAPAGADSEELALAAARFQVANGMDEDGVIGRETLGRLAG